MVARAWWFGSQTAALVTALAANSFLGPIQSAGFDLQNLYGLGPMYLPDNLLPVCLIPLGNLE